MSIQQNKKLAIFGVITKIISVFASAEDLAGNYTAPVALILISAIASLAFMIMAVIRLWKSQRITAILFLTTSLLSLFYVSGLINTITSLLFIWVILLLWVMDKGDRSDSVKTMKNKTIAILGIGSYISSVITSATDLEGKLKFPIALSAITEIAVIVFIIIATVRLWKVARYASIILASSAIILCVLEVIQEVTLPKDGSAIIILLNATKIIHFLVFVYAISLLWEMAKHEGLFKKTFGKYGLTPEESSLVQEDLRKGDKDSALQRFTMAQELRRAALLAQGIDPIAIICLIGQDIKWADIVRQVFRVLEFDRGDTIVLSDGTVKAATRTKPFGYLLVESPILNVKARLPIIHSGDYALATRVYDEPRIAELMKETELLVTYFPQHKLPMGLAGIMHPLHYVLVPRGTLERYYEFNNDEHMAKPAPEKLFKEFVWNGEVHVQVNPDPKF